MLRNRKWKIKPALLSGDGKTNAKITVAGKLLLNDNDDVLISDPKQDNILVFQEDEFDQRWENQDLTLTITPVVQSIINSQPAVVTFLMDEIRMFAGNASLIFPGGVGTGEYTGWYLCNGQSTPNGSVYDLRSKFITGYDPTGGSDYNQQGKGAGEDFVGLTGQQSGTSAHSHGKGTLTVPTSGAHSHIIGCSLDNGDNFNIMRQGGDQRSGNSVTINGPYNGSNVTSAHSHSITGDTADSSTADSIATHENRPEFIAVAFIQYKGV